MATNPEMTSGRTSTSFSEVVPPFDTRIIKSTSASMTSFFCSDVIFSPPFHQPSTYKLDFWLFSQAFRFYAGSRLSVFRSVLDCDFIISRLWYCVNTFSDVRDIISYFCVIAQKLNIIFGECVEKIT